MSNNSKKQRGTIQLFHDINGNQLVERSGQVGWSIQLCHLEGKNDIPSVMKPAQEKIEKIDQRLRIQPLRGGNLLYIT